MIDYMKCIKTGCDIICEDKIFHGDLFYKNGNLILSGVPNESWNETHNNVYLLKENKKPVFYHFQAHNLSQIPCGYDFAAFLVTNVFDVQEDFLKQMKNYESNEVIKFFEGK